MILYGKIYSGKIGQDRNRRIILNDGKQKKRGEYGYKGNEKLQITGQKFKRSTKKALDND